MEEKEKVEKEKLKRNIGKRIDYIRCQKQMNKEQFARLINVSGQHFGKVVLGEKGLSLEKIIEISLKTGYSTDFILKGTISGSEIVAEKMHVVKRDLDEVVKIINSIV